jgi:hypothetical protein
MIWALLSIMWAIFAFLRVIEGDFNGAESALGLAFVTHIAARVQP